MSIRIEINNSKSIKHKNIKQNNNNLLKKKRKLSDSKKQNDKQKRNRGKEYYTLYKDIDKQMKAAQDAYDFKDKIVLCNCDNPLESNFFSYFVKNFHKLGLQKFICTCYKKKARGLKIEIDNDNFATIFGKDFQNKPGKEQDEIIAKFREDEKKEPCYITEMDSDGDCLGDESLDNLKHSHIVITNPPFGKIATQLIKQIVDNNKKFILICELHDILGVRNKNLYNNEKYNIDFGKNNYQMNFITNANKKYTSQGAKWINNIGIHKNNHKDDNKSEDRYDDRVRKMLDIENVYTIPNANLKKTMDFVDEVYGNNHESIISVEQSLFYNQNPIFNKENFSIIGLSDEIKEINDGAERPRAKFARVERTDNSPTRTYTVNKKKCKDSKGKLYYQYGGLHVLCKKKVDLDKIKQEYKKLNLNDINESKRSTGPNK